MTESGWGTPPSEVVILTDPGQEDSGFMGLAGGMGTLIGPNHDSNSPKRQTTPGGLQLWPCRRLNAHEDDVGLSDGFSVRPKVPRVWQATATAPTITFEDLRSRTKVWLKSHWLS